MCPRARVAEIIDGTLHTQPRPAPPHSPAALAPGGKRNLPLHRVDDTTQTTDGRQCVGSADRPAQPHLGVLASARCSGRLPTTLRGHGARGAASAAAADRAAGRGVAVAARDATGGDRAARIRHTRTSGAMASLAMCTMIVSRPNIARPAHRHAPPPDPAPWPHAALGRLTSAVPGNPGLEVHHDATRREALRQTPNVVSAMARFGLLERAGAKRRLPGYGCEGVPHPFRRLRTHPCERNNVGSPSSMKRPGWSEVHPAGRLATHPCVKSIDLIGMTTCPVRRDRNSCRSEALRFR